MNRAPARALFFDVGGTLIEPWPSVGVLYARVAGRHGFAGTPDEMEHAFYESWTALKRPGLTVSRKDWWRELVFRTLGQKHEKCFAELFDLFSRAEAWRVFPDVEETLREARARGLHVGIISNWDERLRPLLKNLGLSSYIDSITISCEVGAEKPDKTVFESALRAANVSAGEAIHIGDGYNEDVRGAESVGIQGIFLQRDSASTPAQTVVRDLRAVLDYLLR